MSTPHYLNSTITWPLNVTLVGCGGNGAQILTGLASLEHALRAIGQRSMHVTTYDSDTVSTSNLGRQPFYPCDVGRHKAIVLTERINMAFGLNWRAAPTHLKEHTQQPPPDLLISCVDTARSRREIGKNLAHLNTNKSIYWLDLGNRATDGQIVLGQTPTDSDMKQPRLKTVLELFPEINNENYEEEDIPSCSLAEALEKQSLFINRVIATHALAMLFDLLVRGSLNYPGLFVNIKSGLTMPMPMPNEKPN